MSSPAPDETVQPAFTDAAGCAQWLGQLQLTNLHQAHATLRAQLDAFNRHPLPGLERLHALELLRETVASVQSDYAKKLAGKKLPLDADEFALFAAVAALWQSLADGYRRCLQSWQDGERQLNRFAALLIQRGLLYGGAQILEHLRAGYEFDGLLWKQLHGLYALCEAHGLQHEAVRDDPGEARGVTCAATYARMLLLCHAHRPELPRQQLLLTERWLARWSEALAVERQCPDAEAAPPLGIDLAGAEGVRPLQLWPPTDTLRCLPTAPLSKLLRVKIALLQQGQMPQQLDLGDGCPAADCLALLTHLQQSWCEGRDNRQAERSAAAQPAQVCYGMEGCFAYIANKPFRQPGKETDVDTLSRKQIVAFGRVLSDTGRHDLAMMGFTLEDWLIEDESLRGARLLRENDPGMRLGPGQLLAVRPTNANAFILGTVVWARVARDGQLRIGVRYLPGLPQAVAMKATGVNLTVSGRYVAALLLPAVAALRAPPSLVAPRDWFRPGRVVEIVRMDNKRLYAKMELSLERGSDFERISFAGIPGNPDPAALPG